jgi:hypothetical protein
VTLEFQREPFRIVQDARHILIELRELLATPTPSLLGQCAPLLEQAIQCMREVEQHAGNSGLNRKEELRKELRNLHSDLTIIRKLMDQASGFYLAWASLLSVATSGYTPQGEAAPLTATSRMSVSG